jgi:chorismate mutase
MNEKGVWLRGVRGAIRVEKNERAEILKATKILLEKIINENLIKIENIVSIFFTTTEDLNAEFPAYALREMGWKYVPALCAKEINVPDSMRGVIRVLVHAYVNKKQNEIKHQYLGETIKFRSDLMEVGNDNCNEK